MYKDKRYAPLSWIVPFSWAAEQLKEKLQVETSQSKKVYGNTPNRVLCQQEQPLEALQAKIVQLQTEADLI